MWGANGIQKASLLPPQSWNPLRANYRSRYKKPATGWSRILGQWNINLFLHRKATNYASWKMASTALKSTLIKHVQG